MLASKSSLGLARRGNPERKELLLLDHVASEVEEDTAGVWIVQVARLVAVEGWLGHVAPHLECSRVKPRALARVVWGEAEWGGRGGP